MTEPDPGVPHPFARPVDARPASSMSAGELRAKREAAERLLLLDVRPAAERKLARLSDDRHIPLGDLPPRVGELPRDRLIVVYDQRGAESYRAVELLAAAGLDRVAVLAGGLEEYAREADPSVGRYRTDEPSYILRQLPRPETGCLAYFVGDPREREAVLIDPGLDVTAYLHTIREEHWRLAAILETHTHADHLAGHAALAHATGAPVVVGRRSPAQYPHRTLADGEAFPFGALELLVLETPGHTRDHLTVRFQDKAFTGDTLLIGSCGRSDLGDGDPDLLYESLHEKLLKLPEATEVYPAHFGPIQGVVDRYLSTVGVERATNEALRQPTPEAFRTYMSEGWPPKPTEFDRIVSANLAAFPP